MRSLLALLVLTLALLPGCKKPSAKTATPASGTAGTTPPPTGGYEQTTAHPSTGVVINPGLGGGGSGGAAQAVRKAAVRAVNQNELNNIRTFIEAASSTGQMPTAQEIAQSLQREAPATFKQIQEGAIVLTGARQREGIWAYTTDPQSTTGEHLIVTKDGVSRMMPQQLRQILQQPQ